MTNDDCFRLESAGRLAGLQFRAQSLVMLADEQLDAKQLEVLRQMTPEQRWRAAHNLYWTVRRHKAAFLKSQHPDWSDLQIEEEVRRTFVNART
jgi:hypothetical protein